MRLNARTPVSATLLLLALSACENGAPARPTPPLPCAYTLSTTTLSIGPNGGSASIGVTTTSQCTWTAASGDAWIAVTSGASGTGNGTVTIGIAANPTTVARTGALTVARQVVAVHEDGLTPCSVAVVPGNAVYSHDSSTGSLTVSSPAHCSWSAVSNAAWLTITAGALGLGNGSVSYAVERNRNPPDRSAAIAINEKTFVVTQSGDLDACEYSVSPVEFSPCMSQQFNMLATVATQEACTWTATPDASWITVTDGHSGSESGGITFRVSDNWDAPRLGVIMVRWPTTTAGQNLRVLQAGCRYGVTTDAISIGAAGGSGRFDVLQQSDPYTCGGPLQDRCLWTAVAGASWITVTTTMPQVGDNPVSFVVAPNGTAAPRTGTIIVRDKVVTITQAGS